MDKEYCVYLHTFPNGKKYVGITKTKPEYRWNNGKGYHYQPVYNAILKYGWGNVTHEILCNGLTKEEAETKEKEYIKLYKSNEKLYGYNIAEGGNVPSGIAYTEERRKKVAESNHRRGMKEATKEKLRQANLGKRHSQEAKNKMSASRMGEKNAFYGKHHTAETKAKSARAISMAYMARRPFDIGKYNLQQELIAIYTTIGEAEKQGFQRKKYSKELNFETYVESHGYLWKKIIVSKGAECNEETANLIY